MARYLIQLLEARKRLWAERLERLAAYLAKH
ncbi:hypothetical protein FF80_00553 [Devosia sp. LC5]|nr:hypothetical protein FF80_00553 [Devosia sp. LC5]